MTSSGSLVPSRASGYSCFVETTKRDLERLSRAVAVLAASATRGMSRAFDVNRVGVLRLAVGRGQVTPSEAAGELDLPPSSVTRHVQALEAAGHVAVTRSPDDARSCLVRPTGAGRAEVQAIERAGLEVFAGVVADWAPEDVRTLATLTERLTADWSARGPAQQARVRRTRPVARWQHDPIPADGEEAP
jgi:DNA-binding MarR family transcriptional regulator